LLLKLLLLLLEMMLLLLMLSMLLLLVMVRGLLHLNRRTLLLGHALCTEHEVSIGLLVRHLHSPSCLQGLQLSLDLSLRGSVQLRRHQTTVHLSLHSCDGQTVGWHLHWHTRAVLTGRCRCSSCHLLGDVATAGTVDGGIRSMGNVGVTSSRTGVRTGGLRAMGLLLSSGLKGSLMNASVLSYVCY
jgi:hypothetical protein